MRSAAGRFKSLPLRFERNIGQAEARVDALAHGRGYTLLLCAGSAVLTLTGDDLPRSLRMDLVGPHSSAAQYGEEVPGVSNYLIGNDRSRWRTDVRGYASVRYERVYPDVDLVFYGRDGELEYDFIIAPGGDPGAIAFALDGADSLRVNDAGALQVRVGSEVIAFERPVAYQPTVGGRRSIDASYRLEGSTIRFALAPHDRMQPLVIDPVLVYSRTLGGAGQQSPGGMATDAAGNIYLFGTTSSSSYPIASPMQPAFGGGTDMVLTKLNPTGTALVYSTYLGGPGADRGMSIAVTPEGEVFLAGESGAGFPLAPGFRWCLSCSYFPLFVVIKLNTAGNALVYEAILRFRLKDATSLYLAVTASGEAVLTGNVDAEYYPMRNAAQPNYGGGASDGFVTIFTQEGDDLMFSSYLGGAGTDIPTGIVAHHADDTIYVYGVTSSTDFRTVRPLQSALSGSSDGFLTRFREGRYIDYSTFLGGSGSDGITAVAVSVSGVIHVAGDTESTDFPLRNPFFPFRRAGFLTRLTPDGTLLLYSTYFGGTATQRIAAIATDAEDRTFIAGHTSSPTDFPLLIQSQGFSGGGTVFCAACGEGFAAMIDGAGNLLHSTFLGGPGSEQVAGLFAAPDGEMYVFGGTSASNFPTFGAPLIDTPMPPPGPPPPPQTRLFMTRMATRLSVAATSPNVLPAGEPGRVVLTGANFAPDVRVSIAGVDATDISVSSGTSLVATLPSLPEGTYDVTVANPSPHNQLAVLEKAVQTSTCSFTVPQTQVFMGQGGTRTIAVQSTPAGCGWWASTTTGWITVLTSAAIPSPASLRVTVTPNPTPAARQGTVRIADRVITVIQEPATPFDFNRDNRMDLIWQHEIDGRLAMWLMDGTTQRSGMLLSPSVPDTSWKIVATADLDRDGQFDLVWQNVADGRIAAWLMNGSSLREASYFTPGQVVDSDWHIRTAGDFDDDGWTDLIWQHSTQGLVAIWSMNGLEVTAGRVIGPDLGDDLSWRIVGSGDFNGDGHRDLLWHRGASGDVAVWLMDGATVLSAQFAWGQQWDTTWSVAAVGDLDGDGASDVVWQKRATGELSVWLAAGGGVLTPSQVSDVNWRLAGPR